MGSGQAQIVRPAGSFALPIGGTNAPLQTHGVTMGLRFAF